MRATPLEIARAEVDECWRLLDRLITTSEAFDFAGAREALGLVAEKIGELEERRRELEQLRTPARKAIPVPHS